jgi:hypothetical protein
MDSNNAQNERGASISVSKASSSSRRVKHGKSEALKNRLRALIHARGLSEPDFFNRLGMSRQHWYSISWGIWDAPIDVKVRIAEALKVDSSVIWGEMK